MRRHLIIVVPVGLAIQANQRCKEIDPVGGERTFTVGLSLTGQAPATHHWCGWNLSDDEETAVRTKMRPHLDSGAVKVFESATISPDDVLRQVNLKRVERLPI